MTSRALTIACFEAIGVGLVALWLHSHLASARVERLSAVLLRMARRRAPRIVILLAWWWVGWHFLAFAGSA